MTISASRSAPQSACHGRLRSARSCSDANKQEKRLQRSVHCSLSSMTVEGERVCNVLCTFQTRDSESLTLLHTFEGTICHVLRTLLSPNTRAAEITRKQVLTQQ